MALDKQPERVLRLYGESCRPLEATAVAPGTSFSGAQMWRLRTPRGELCLRRWPREHPSPQRLEFIQAVLWHVDQEGFHDIPLPLETEHHHGYVRHEGYLWELAPWLPGLADFDRDPNGRRLHNALVAVARFHQAALSFPLPESGPAASPGLIERGGRLRDLMVDGLARIRHGMREESWPELAAAGRRALDLFAPLAPQITGSVEAAARLRVCLQPCIRDIWSAHVLFVEDEVSGLVDFGGLRPENVAADVARLLGSLARDDAAAWQAGLAAYQTVRPLSDDELRLVVVFDRSSALLSPLQWLDWLFVQRRRFPNRDAVIARYEQLLDRLARLAEMPSADMWS